ncbi:MAG TPA: hypothetical protein H9875_00390 [Candidatus Levilactobacillus faecigallinarum]|uniref:DUF2730 family protein n=1 Tax=Candidatus Levilactobacillus faecigallinarum TaxID=2838638 RepID=A0A9D1QS70_9LACO|nr:hypothetical protein [Candidatus Levilactobacillus faecigallinarum]
MRINLFQIIVTAVVTYGASWLTLKGTRYTAASSKESAFAQVTPDMAEQIRDLLKESQAKNEQITALTARVKEQAQQLKEQSQQLKEQSKVMMEQGHTINALNGQIGSLRQQFSKIGGK